MKLKITVHGVAYEVDVEILDAGEGFVPASALPPVAPSNGVANGGAAHATAGAPTAGAPTDRAPYAKSRFQGVE